MYLNALNTKKMTMSDFYLRVLSEKEGDLIAGKHVDMFKGVTVCPCTVNSQTG